MLSLALQRLIAESLDKRRLEKDEIRRLEGVGAHFICREDVPLPNEYNVLATFEFDGIPIRFVRRFVE
jgi:hypothetical protein